MTNLKRVFVFLLCILSLNVSAQIRVTNFGYFEYQANQYEQVVVGSHNIGTAFTAYSIPVKPGERGFYNVEAVAVTATGTGMVTSKIIHFNRPLTGSAVISGIQLGLQQNRSTGINPSVDFTAVVDATGQYINLNITGTAGVEFLWKLRFTSGVQAIHPANQ